MVEFRGPHSRTRQVVGGRSDRDGHPWSGRLRAACARFGRREGTAQGDMSCDDPSPRRRRRPRSSPSNSCCAQRISLTRRLLRCGSRSRWRRSRTRASRSCTSSSGRRMKPRPDAYSRRLSSIDSGNWRRGISSRADTRRRTELVHAGANARVWEGLSADSEGRRDRARGSDRDGRARTLRDRHDALRIDGAAGGQASLVPRADAEELTPTATFLAGAGSLSASRPRTMRRPFNGPRPAVTTVHCRSPRPFSQ